MVFVLLFFSLSSFSGVVKYDVTTTDSAEFTFQTACARSFTHDSPLVEAKTSTEIDCMSKSLDAGDFCEKALASDPYLLRGEVDAEKKVIRCYSGKKAILKYQCVKFSDRPLCADAKKACSEMKRKLARRLDTVHASVTKNEKGVQELNCYFESLPLKEEFRGSL
jgi:hypothetical protein